MSGQLEDEDDFKDEDDRDLPDGSHFDLNSIVASVQWGAITADLCDLIESFSCDFLLK